MSRAGPVAQPKPWTSLPVAVEEELKVAFTRRQILALVAMMFGEPFDPEAEREFPQLVKLVKQLAAAKK